MDHVVHTQLKLYSTSWLQSFKALFHILGMNKVSFCVLEGSQVGELKATWSSDSQIQNGCQISTTKLEGIVGVDETSNQAIIQQFSKCTFEFPVAWVCTSRQDHYLWLNVAGNSEKGKDSIPS